MAKLQTINLDGTPISRSVLSAMDTVRGGGGELSPEAVMIITRKERGEITSEESIKLLVESAKKMHANKRRLAD